MPQNSLLILTSQLSSSRLERHVAYRFSRASDRWSLGML